MVQYIFTTEICSKSFNFTAFDELRCQFDIISQNQNFHRQHDHQHKILMHDRLMTNILFFKAHTLGK